MAFPMLHVLRRDGTRAAEFPVVHDTVVFGADEKADVRVRRPGVAACHAQLRMSVQQNQHNNEQQSVLQAVLIPQCCDENAGVSAVTTINDEVVLQPQVILKAGDVIGIGGRHFLYQRTCSVHHTHPLWTAAIMGVLASSKP